MHYPNDGTNLNLHVQGTPQYPPPPFTSTHLRCHSLTRRTKIPHTRTYHTCVLVRAHRLALTKKLPGHLPNWDGTIAAAAAAAAAPSSSVKATNGVQPAAFDPASALAWRVGYMRLHARTLSARDAKTLSRYACVCVCMCTCIHKTSIIVPGVYRIPPASLLYFVVCIRSMIC